MRNQPNTKREHVIIREPDIALDEVDDPYERGATRLVLRSLRDDRLARLRAHGHIQQHQFAAGRAWQRLYERAEIGGARSIDPTKLRVDTSGGDVVVVARRLRAIKDLVHISRKVGASGQALLYDVLVDGLALRTIAHARGVSTRLVGLHLRQCLDEVAREMHLA